MRIVRIISFALLGAGAAASPGAAETGAGGPQGPVLRARYVMGTLCEARAFGEPLTAASALEAALDRIQALDDVLTVHRPEGELARLNARIEAVRRQGAGPQELEVSDDLFRALEGALDWAERTGGLYDPTLGALTAALRAERSGGDATGRAAGAAAGRATWRQVELDPAARAVVVEGDGVAFDLGGFGKGFALDEAARVLRARGVESAVLNFGGQVLALGAPPGAEGWIVDVADPRDRGRAAGSVLLADASVATTGNAERALDGGGRLVGHVVDPRDGAPVTSPGSATVRARSAAAADALSTALFVAGPSGARGLLPAAVDHVFLLPGGGAEGLSGVGTLGLAPASAAPGDEEPDGSRADDPRIEELERKVDILAGELEALRTGRPAGDAAEDDGGGRYGLAPGASKVYRRDRGFSLGGYGEWIYEGFDARNDAGAPSGLEDRADFLRFVLYAGYKFDERYVLNTEIEFEHASTGKDGEVSLEFATLDILLRPAVNVRTGLVLVPVGLINELHEPPTFLGARRPDVERVVLPATWRELGAGVFGEAGPVSYRAYVHTSLDGSDFTASGGLRGGRQKGSKAKAEDLAVSGRLDLTGIPGLLAGVSFFHGDTGQGATVAGRVVDGTVTTLDVHADWQWRGLELRGLLARAEVDDAEALSSLAGETVGSRIEGWYLQAGYDVLAVAARTRHQLVPFVRVEELDTQARVPAPLAATVTGENDRRIRTVGVVYKPIESIAVKADVQDVDTRAGDGVDQVNVAVGFYF